jgi:aarF domain-containing kinase
VKSISDTYRKTLAQAVLSIAPTEDDGADIEALWQLMHDLGIVVKDGAPREAGAALGMWMFDGSATTLPGNYDAHELSPKSPVRDIETFPEDLVLIARSSVLVKGMGSRLNVPWSLAKEWRQLAEDVVRGEESNPSHEKTSGKRRLAMKRLKQLGSSSVKKLPAPVRSRVARIVLKVVERRERK